MKGIILFPFFIFLYLSAHSQVVAIQNDRNNIVYLGCPSRITVAVEGCKSSSIVVTTNNGKVFKDKYDVRGHYFFRPKKAGAAIIYVSKKTKNGILTLIDSVFFRVEMLPPLKANLSGKTGGNISQSELVAQIAPAVRGSEYYLCGICYYHQIIQFTVTVKRGEREIFRRTIANNRGAIIDNETHDFFYQLKNNDKVFFRDFTEVGDPIDTVLNVAPLEFTITDAHKYYRLKEEETAIEVDFYYRPKDTKKNTL